VKRSSRYLYNSAGDYRLNRKGYLEIDFIRVTNAKTWGIWGAQNFERQLPQALNDAKSIHFNLNGIDNVWSALSEGARGLGSSRVTSYELWQIYSNPKFMEKTTFYLDGKVVSNPFTR
jgi:hypothetical protein